MRNQKLYLDFESRSCIDLREAGLDNYVRDPTTRVLMLAYAFGDGTVELWEPHKSGEMPVDLQASLFDPAVTKVAWNATFESHILQHVLKLPVSISQFQDAQIWASHLSLPRSLDDAGAALGLPQDEAKMKEGKRLINLFCKPFRLGGAETLFGIEPPQFHDWDDRPEDWKLFGNYCFAPHHNLLGTDLVWKPAAQFQVGDAVLGFDEISPNRRFRKAIIEKISFADEPTFDVELEAGHHFIVTKDHQWLVDNRGPRSNVSGQSLHWVRTEKLLHTSARKDATCSRIPRILHQWTTNESRDAGWLAGIFDGEGTLGFHNFGGRRTASTLSVAQNPGAVLDEIRRLIPQLGFTFSECNHKKCKKIFLTRGRYELLRFLGSIRPIRMIEKINFDELGRLECRMGTERIISIRPAGTQTIIKIQTSTGTLIVDGYPMHNCRQDVVAERGLLNRMKVLPLPEQEQKNWCLDQKINETGLPVNLQFVGSARRLAERAKDELEKTLKLKTGLENPNSVEQMLAWAKTQGYPHKSLGKEFVSAAIAGNKLTALGRECLKLRQESSKTSYTKLEKIQAITSADGMLRHQFAFMGAARTSRWSSYGGIQAHNFPRPIKAVESNLERAIELIETENYESLAAEFDSVIDVTTSCLRQVFQAPEGKTLVVCDLAAIEPRVLGWASGCAGLNKAFREDLDIYTDFGTHMFGKTYEELRHDKQRRQICKPAVLACGYSLGSGVKRNQDGTYFPILGQDRYGNIIKTGLLGYAENMGVKMTPEQAHFAHQLYRQIYPEVVVFWKRLQEAAIAVVQDEPGDWRVGPVRFDKVKLDTKEVMRIHLPSGRALHYLNPRTETVTKVFERKNGRGTYETEVTNILYDGVGHGVGKRGEGWMEAYLYSGKIAENLTQAIARDVLVNGLRLADKAGMTVCGHFHDEIMCLEEDDPFGLGLGDLRAAMSASPSWAPDLLLGAEGYIGKFYRKG